MYDSTKTKCIGFLKRLHGKVLWCKLPWDQRMLVVESELKMSLIQLPAQRQLSHEARPERSGLWTTGSWKPPRTDTARPFWALAPLLHCLMEERFLPVCSSLVSVSVGSHVVPTCCCAEPSTTFPITFLQALGRCWWSTFEAGSAPGWTPIIYLQQTHDP